MDEKKIEEIKSHFMITLSGWMPYRDSGKLFDAIKEDLISDIEETADTEFNLDDIHIAMRRVIMEKCGIIE